MDTIHIIHDQHTITQLSNPSKPHQPHQSGYSNTEILDVYVPKKSMPAPKWPYALVSVSLTMPKTLCPTLTSWAIAARYMLVAIQNKIPSRKRRPQVVGGCLNGTAANSADFRITLKGWYGYEMTGNVGDHNVAINVDLRKIRNKPSGESHGLPVEDKKREGWRLSKIRKLKLNKHVTLLCNRKFRRQMQDKMTGRVQLLLGCQIW